MRADVRLGCSRARPVGVEWFLSRCGHGFDAPRILVIEDEGLIASVTAETLADEG